MVAEVISEAAARYRANARTLLGVALLVAAPAAVLAGVFATRGAAGLATTFVIQVVLGGVVFAASVLIVAVDIEGLGPASIGDAVKGVQTHLTRLLVVSLLFHLALVVGLALLIPAFIVATFWLVAIPLGVIERRWLDAFGRSAELVRGYGTQVFGIAVLVILLIIGAPLLLAWALSLAGTPGALQAGIGTFVTFILIDTVVATLMTASYFALRRRELADDS